MSAIKQLVVLITVLAVSRAQQSRPGQSPFNCPQPTGQFEYREDCSKFWQCDNGQASLADCPSQLIFNPAQGYCDYPHSVPNPTCQQVANRNQDKYSNLCQNTPAGANPTHAFHVGSPDLCNAFFICAKNYVHFPCIFCPEGSYYSIEANGCREMRGQDMSQLCGSRQMVEHKDKVNRTIEAACWPNLSSLRPQQPTPTPFRG